MGWLAPCFLLCLLSLSVPGLLFPPVRLRGRVAEGADVSMRMLCFFLACHVLCIAGIRWQCPYCPVGSLWPHSLNLDNFHDVHLAQRRYTQKVGGRPLHCCPFLQPAIFPQFIPLYSLLTGSQRQISKFTELVCFGNECSSPLLAATANFLNPISLVFGVRG